MRNPNAIALQVNQQLAFCRVQINAAKSLLESDDIESRLAVHAHLDAAMQQLNRALVFYVHEVAQQFGLKLSENLNSIRDLFKSLSQQSDPVPEINELLNLQQQPGSWLCQFIDAFKDPEFIAQQFGNTESDKGDREPPFLIVSNREHEISPLAYLLDWRQALQALIERQRENLLEQ